MKLHYHPETDSLTIEVIAAPGVEAREIVEGLLAGLDAEGNVVRIDRPRFGQARPFQR